MMAQLNYSTVRKIGRKNQSAGSHHTDSINLYNKEVL